MKVIFNITENKNKATFLQEVVKINTSFNQTENIVKPKFQIGYYPLPVNLENYYTKNETNLLLENYYLKNETYSKNEIDNLLDLKADLSQLNNYYTKSETFSQSQINTGLGLKLDKGGYVGTAQDLYNRFEGKITAGITSIPKVGYGASGTVLENSVVTQINGKVGIGLAGEASEKLDVNGNVKAIQFKDQYGNLTSNRVVTITGNTTLSEIHNGAVLNVTNTCNITIPTGLDVNFQCVVLAKGSVIVTFVNSGVTVYAPSGLLLKTDKMAALISTSANNFNLTGELATV